MSDINEKNFVGATAVIVGSAGGPVETRDFPSGGQQAQLSIAVGKGYMNKKVEPAVWVDQGTDWYTLVAAPEYAAQNWPDVGPGDKVRVDDARLELKAFKKNNGEIGVDATLRFGTLVVVEAKNSSGRGRNEEVTPF